MVKCYNCKLKLTLVERELTCKCNENFCIKCRLPEIHKCSYDYGKEGRKQLKNKLIKVCNNKIEII